MDIPNGLKPCPKCGSRRLVLRYNATGEAAITLDAKGRIKGQPVQRLKELTEHVGTYCANCTEELDGD